MSASTRYSDYTVTIKEDVDKAVYYTESCIPGTTVRVCYYVARIPRTKEFIVRFLAGATAEERAGVTAELDRIPARFTRWERLGATYRHWSKIRKGWLYRAWGGRAVDDPLVQLELEMMIDLTREEVTTR